MLFGCGISLYLQGTLQQGCFCWIQLRYIPVPTGNSLTIFCILALFTVYPCTYRELFKKNFCFLCSYGISLYLQGTLLYLLELYIKTRYIPVPTGNSQIHQYLKRPQPVYPCTYRELQRSTIVN